MTRSRRLTIERKQPELANADMMNWARYLRHEAEHNGCEILDTSSLSLDESVSYVMARLKTDRPVQGWDMGKTPDSKGRKIANNDALSSRLRQVYWIGGGSGGGKSTIAKRLADQYGLRLYSMDTMARDHGRRPPPEERPLACAFDDMEMDERWLNRSPETMLDTFHFFRGECFDRIVEDLLEFPPDHWVIAEGFRLLPDRVKPLLHVTDQSVWLLPTPDFRLKSFESRGTLWDIAGKTSNPERALRNLLARDGLFTDCLRQETQSVGLPVIEVDTSLTEDALVDRVAKQFGL